MEENGAIAFDHQSPLHPLLIVPAPLLGTGFRHGPFLGHKLVHVCWSWYINSSRKKSLLLRLPSREDTLPPSSQWGYPSCSWPEWSWDAEGRRVPEGRVLRVSSWPWTFLRPGHSLWVWLGIFVNSSWKPWEWQGNGSVTPLYSPQTTLLYLTHGAPGALPMLFPGPSQGAQGWRICLPMQEMQVWSLGREDPLEKWQPTPVFLPGKSHGQRSLWAVVHGVTTSQTWLSEWSCKHAYTLWDRLDTEQVWTGSGFTFLFTAALQSLTIIHQGSVFQIWGKNSPHSKKKKER